MNEAPKQDPNTVQGVGQAPPNPMLALVSNPAIASLIADMSALIRERATSRQRTEHSVKWWLLLWAFSLALVVVGAVTWLTFADKISSDALSFLIGTLVGAAFTFVRDFFPSK